MIVIMTGHIFNTS